MILLLLAAFAVLFACADRLAGGDYIHDLQSIVAADAARWKTPKWISVLLVEIAFARSTFWAAVALAATFGLVGPVTPFGPKLALLAAGFAAWRWEGWTVFGGAIDPKTQMQRLGLFERHLLAVPAFLPFLIWIDASHRVAAILGGVIFMTLFAVFATFLGAVLAAEEAHWAKANVYIEAIRGAGLGGLVYVALLTGA
jgi:hypothetical protein